MELWPGPLGYRVGTRIAAWSSELVIRHLKWAGAGSRSPHGDLGGHSHGAAAAENNRPAGAAIGVTASPNERESLALAAVPAAAKPAAYLERNAVDSLPKGELDYKGRRVNPKAIRKTALFTIEGERDDICALGQTVAAHDLCSSLRPYRKKHYMQAGVGHYGVFSGRRWATQIYPLVRNTILANE